MNKYQRVMEHVKVDDEMKKRILQNLEKELESGEDKARDQVVKTSKVVPFRQRFGEGIKKYGAMVAMLAILLVGTAAVIRFTGGVSNTSAPSMSDSAMEAPAAAPAEEAAEAPAATESAYEEAAEAPAQEAEMAAEPASNEGLMEAESPVYDSEATAEQAAEETVEPADSTQSTGSAQVQEASGTSEPVQEAEPVKPVQPVGSAKTEGAEQEIIGSTQPSVVHYIGPVVLLIIVLAVIALIIWLIIYLIRKYRSRK